MITKPNDLLLDMDHFADQLKHLRTQRQLTQTRLAELLGVSPRVYNRWERATATPHLDTLVQLAEILQVSLDELVGRAHVASEPKLRNLQLNALYRQADRLSDEDQKALAIVLDSLVKRQQAEQVFASK
jgi:transcriptional regulator with XRE-family HTH domain